MSARRHDSYISTSQPHIRRRQQLRLPKRRKHMVGALTFLIAAMSTPLLAVQAFGDRSDAQNKGAVEVLKPNTDFAPDFANSPLGNDRQSFPDLLQGEVALGQNPTDRLDALGNLKPSLKPQSGTPTERLAMTDPRNSDDPAANIKIITGTVSTPAPPLDPSLSRSSEFGPLPARNSQGRTVLSAYKRPTPNANGPRVALIIGGLGINPALTQRAIDELPPDVTLSFATQTPDLQSWINKARAAGHEVLLEIPMESADGTSLPRILQSNLSATDLTGNLQFHLSRAQGYIGVINYNGRPFLTRSDVVAPLLDELNRSGLGLFVDGSFPTPSLPAFTDSIGLPFAEGFGQIDPQADRAIIIKRLSALSESATPENVSVGVGFVFPQTLDVVKGWTATLSGQGRQLVPASSALSDAG